jgi:hypothetical protein
MPACGSDFESTFYVLLSFDIRKIELSIITRDRLTYRNRLQTPDSPKMLQQLIHMCNRVYTYL